MDSNEDDGFACRIVEPGDCWAGGNDFRRSSLTLRITVGSAQQSLDCTIQFEIYRRLFFSLTISKYTGDVSLLADCIYTSPQSIIFDLNISKRQDFTHETCIECRQALCQLNSNKPLRIYLTKNIITAEKKNIIYRNK